jgi:hypothetical protein
VDLGQVVGILMIATIAVIVLGFAVGPLLATRQHTEADKVTPGADPARGSGVPHGLVEMPTIEGSGSCARSPHVQRSHRVGAAPAHADRRRLRDWNDARVFAQLHQPPLARCRPAEAAWFGSVQVLELGHEGSYRGGAGCGDV